MRTMTDQTPYRVGNRTIRVGSLTFETTVWVRLAGVERTPGGNMIQCVEYTEALLGSKPVFWDEWDAIREGLEERRG
jgi:hypothetical protein